MSLMGPNLLAEAGIGSHPFLTADQNIERIYEEFDRNSLNCKSHCQNIFGMQDMTNGGIGSLKTAEHAPVDVLEISRNMDAKLVAKEDPDATENSSSFADTASGNGETGISDTEVESQFFGEDDLAPQFDRFSSGFPTRKKKLTNHWRNYIHPLMWRCKWTEIKIKQLELQASKYDRYLAAYEQSKHVASDQTIEQCGSRSLLFRYKGRGNKPMRRFKRKRVEDTTDVKFYMSNHNLFSQRENKRLDLDGVACEDLGNSDHQGTSHDDFGLHNDVLCANENDNFLEHVLGKIELVHSRVCKLRAQLDSVMINNSDKFSSSENLSQNVVCEVQTSSIHSPTHSACNGDTVSAGGLYTSSHHMLDYDLGDFMMPDGAISSFGEAISVPDIIESTVGLLSSIDVTQHHAQIIDSSEKILDNILASNETAEVEGSTVKDVHNQSAENSGEDESNNVAMSLVSDFDGVAKTVISQEYSALTSCLSSDVHFPKNKRKRGERKAGTGNWNRQLPTEQPDS